MYGINVRMTKEEMAYFNSIIPKGSNAAEYFRFAVDDLYSKSHTPPEKIRNIIVLGTDRKTMQVGKEKIEKLRTYCEKNNIPIGKYGLYAIMATKDKKVRERISCAMYGDINDTGAENTKETEPKPKAEAPKAEVQKAETPKAETPKAETPKAEVSAKDNGVVIDETLIKELLRSFRDEDTPELITYARIADSIPGYDEGKIKYLFKKNREFMRILNKCNTQIKHKTEKVKACGVKKIVAVPVLAKKADMPPVPAESYKTDIGQEIAEIYESRNNTSPEDFPVNEAHSPVEENHRDTKTAVKLAAEPGPVKKITSSDQIITAVHMVKDMGYGNVILLLADTLKDLSEAREAAETAINKYNVAKKQNDSLKQQMMNCQTLKEREEETEKKLKEASFKLENVNKSHADLSEKYNMLMNTKNCLAADLEKLKAENEKLKADSRNGNSGNGSNELSVGKRKRLMVELPFYIGDKFYGQTRKVFTVAGINYSQYRNEKGQIATSVRYHSTDGHNDLDTKWPDDAGIKMSPME